MTLFLHRLRQLFSHRLLIHKHLCHKTQCLDCCTPLGMTSHAQTTYFEEDLPLSIYGTKLNA